MDVAYENGCIVITHDNGIVTTCTAAKYSDYIDHKVSKLDELQTEIDHDRIILDLIEASEN